MPSAPPPIVTGISPNDGPPGTRVTIRGENLGLNYQDFIGLTICGVDCLLTAEWKSSSKIIARFGAGSGLGDVIVISKSGGKGTSTVQFKGKLNESIGPLKESAVWIEESYTMNFLMWGRKRPTSPSPLHQDNPLGLSDEGNTKKLPEEMLQECFPDGSGNLISENFVPAWFLLENHNEASFDDLRRGLTCLRRKVNNQKEGELSFLKANVGSVMDQLDTLTALAIAKRKDDFGEKNLDILEQNVEQTKNEAVALFQDVLGRKDHADTTRSALSVLQKFKFLFNLPCTIERNIQKGDYDVVINDYAKAKSLCSETKVQLFKKVYEQVEQRIDMFKDLLIGRLRDLPSPIEEQKRYIRYLLNLEYPGDPAWICVEYQFKFIAQVFNSCKDFHLKQEILAAENIVSTAYGKMKRVSIKRSKKKNDMSLGSAYRTRQSEECRPPDHIIFVEELTEIVSDTVPDLWKLGQAYLKGDLSVIDDDENRVNKIDASYKLKFEEMLLDTFRLHSNLIRSAILPHTLSQSQIKKFDIVPWPLSPSDSVSDWLPHCIRFVRGCYSSLVALHLPAESLDVIQQLIFDLRVACLHHTFAQSIGDIERFYVRETWVLQMDDESGATTQLPALYENVVLETLQLVKETILTTGLRENELLGDADTANKMTLYILKLMQVFPKTLETLAQQRETSPISNDGMETAFTESKKLMVVLSNCDYTRRNVIPRFEEHIKKSGYPNPKRIVMEVEGKFLQLHDRLFSSYIELKSLPFVKIIETNMYIGGFQWSECLIPSSVGCYIKQIIIELIAVHAEVYSVVPQLIKSVMVRMVQLVSRELANLFCRVSKFNHAGSLQGRIDLQALQTTLYNYKSSDSLSAFKEALNCLSGMSSPEDQKVVEENIKRFQQQMKFQLICFRCKLYRKRDDPEGECFVVNAHFNPVALAESEDQNSYSGSPLELPFCLMEETMKAGFAEDKYPLQVALPPEDESENKNKSSENENMDIPKETRLNVEASLELLFRNLEYGVSVKTDCEMDRQEFVFTLYDFDGEGKVTKDDIAGLVRSIYETVGTAIKLPPKGSKTIKVKLTIAPDKRKKNHQDNNKNNKGIRSPKCTRNHSRPTTFYMQNLVESLERCAIDKNFKVKPKNAKDPLHHRPANNRDTVIECRDRRNHYLDLAGVENYSSQFSDSCVNERHSARCPYQLDGTHVCSRTHFESSRRTNGHHRSRSHDLAADSLLLKCQLFDRDQIHKLALVDLMSSERKGIDGKGKLIDEKSKVHTTKLSSDHMDIPSHHHSHRHRHKDHQRAMQQVAHWIEKQNLGGNVSRKDRTKHSNFLSPFLVERHEHHEHHHVHHHHHHYSQV
uniref:Exocyst complex component 2 n=1 Tax=Strigamia maritima TaxID=126957 RepID=T1J496_STRMM